MYLHCMAPVLINIRIRSSAWSRGVSRRLCRECSGMTTVLQLYHIVAVVPVQTRWKQMGAGGVTEQATIRCSEYSWTAYGTVGAA